MLLNNENNMKPKFQTRGTYGISIATRWTEVLPIWDIFAEFWQVAILPSKQNVSKAAMLKSIHKINVLLNRVSILTDFHGRMELDEFGCGPKNRPSRVRAVIGF